MDENKLYEVSIDIVNTILYFKCYLCGEMLSMDTPPSFEEFEHLYESLKQEHRHVEE